VLIRFLTQDNEGLAEKAEKLFRKAEKHELEIPEFIICEVVWVLLAVYKLSKTEVIEKIQGIMGLEAFGINRKVVGRAIELYSGYSISFVDAMLLAKSMVENKKLVSFDERLDKIYRAG
jgi:predicted nucleic-acid-binding protein